MLRANWERAKTAAALVQVMEEQARTEAALKAEARRREQARRALDAMSSQLIGERLSRQKVLLPEHKTFLEQALAWYEQFARDTNQDESSRAGVAGAYFRVGRIQQRLGMNAEAETTLRRAEALYEQLTRDFPDNSEYLAGMADSGMQLGILLFEQGSSKEAEGSFRNVVALRQRLAENSRAHPKGRLDIAMAENTFGDALHNLGRLLQEKDKRAEAEAAYRQAIAIRAGQVAKFPEVASYREGLGLSSNNLANLLLQLGQWSTDSAFRKRQWTEAARCVRPGRGPAGVVGESTFPPSPIIARHWS